MPHFDSVEAEKAYYAIKRHNRRYRTKRALAASYELLKRFLVIAAIGYGVKHREEIGNNLRAKLEQNETIQESVSSVKWLIDELRPLSEKEKAHRRAWAAEQARRAADFRDAGVEPYVEYVTPADGKKWEQAKADWAEIRKELHRE